MTIAQAPEKGPGQPFASLGSFSSLSVQVTDASTKISRTYRKPKSDSLPQTPGIIASEIDREPEQDSFHQTPGSVLYSHELAQDSLPQASDHNIISPSRRSLSSAGHEKTRSVIPSSNRSLPWQFTSRPGRQRSMRIRVSSSSSSSSRASSSSRERSRHTKHKHRRSRHRSRFPLPRPTGYGHARHKLLIIALSVLPGEAFLLQDMKRPGLLHLQVTGLCLGSSLLGQLGKGLRE